MKPIKYGCMCRKDERERQEKKATSAQAWRQHVSDKFSVPEPLGGRRNDRRQRLYQEYHSLLCNWECLGSIPLLECFVTFS